MIEKELPYPPTINHYYGRTKHGSLYINQKGKSYRAAVQYNMRKVRPIEGKIKLHVDVFPPDKRRRDMDNLNKCLLDSLQSSGIIKDDYDIDQLSMTRREVVDGGKVVIKLEQIKPSNLFNNNVKSIIIVEEIKCLNERLKKEKQKLHELGKGKTNE